MLYQALSAWHAHETRGAETSTISLLLSHKLSSWCEFSPQYPVTDLFV